MDRIPFARVAVSLALGSAALSARAEGTVDLEVLSGHKVLGTLRPASEEESFLCTLLRGTTVQAKVKAKGRGGPAPRLALLVGDAPLPGATVVDRGRGQALLPIETTFASGYELRVSGDGALDGDYQLSVRWTPRSSWSHEDDGSGPLEMTFAAPPGTSAKVTVSALAGSAFVPRLVELVDPGGVSTPIDGGTKAGPLPLAKRGEYTLRFANDGGAGGWRADVKLALNRSKRTKVDIRDTALAGPFAGGNAVFGRVVNDANGGTVGLDEEGAPIDGSSVNVPPDSMGSPAIITIAEDDVFVVEDGIHPAGPAVKFGPAGQTFSPKAAVTIPFDPASFAGAPDDMVVYLLNEETGELEPVEKNPPYEFGSGTVTFYTSHFSTGLATSRDPRPLRGRYVAYEVFGRPESGLGAVAAVARHEFAFGPQGWTVDGATHEVRIDPTARLTGDSVQAVGFVDVVSDRDVVLVESSETEFARIVRGRSGDAMLLTRATGSDLSAAVLVRRVNDATLRTVAGRFIALEMEFFATSSGALGAVARRGGATIGPDGKFSLRFQQPVSGRAFVGPSGVRLRDREGDFPAYVDLDVLLGGDLLAGVRSGGASAGPPGHDATVAFVCLVREGRGQRAADLLGGVAMDLAGFDVPGTGRLADTTWRRESGTARHEPPARVSFLGDVMIGGYGVEDMAEYRSETLTRPSAPYRLASNGSYDVPGHDVFGALTARDDVLIVLRADGRTSLAGFGIAAPPTPTNR